MTEEEKRRAYHKAYYVAHKEEIKAYMKAYNESHREDKLERYCSHIENIENYELAKADDFIGWDVHHRLETHNSDGERRTVDLSKAELVALGTYYDRPASELIFLKQGDHMSLHNNGKPMPEETKAKIAAAHRGKCHSEETRAKIQESMRGHSVSSETRAKMSTSRRGKHFSDETRAKMREAAKHRRAKTSAKNN